MTQSGSQARSDDEKWFPGALEIAEIAGQARDEAAMRELGWECFVKGKSENNGHRVRECQTSTGVVAELVRQYWMSNTDLKKTTFPSLITRH